MLSNYLGLAVAKVKAVARVAVRRAAATVIEIAWALLPHVKVDLQRIQLERAKSKNTKEH